jgi:hypothetical protein
MDEKEKRTRKIFNDSDNQTLFVLKNLKDVVELSISNMETNFQRLYDEIKTTNTKFEENISALYEENKDMLKMILTVSTESKERDNALHEQIQDLKIRVEDVEELICTPEHKKECQDMIKKRLSHRRFWYETLDTNKRKIITGVASAAGFLFWLLVFKFRDILEFILSNSHKKP